MKRIKSLKIVLALFTLLGLTACNIAPEPIKYGEDACDFCAMTIVSQAHSAQGVTQKGKQYKYDAIECMVNDVVRNNREFSISRVANYIEPGTMISVDNADFIINDTIKSPMGENLAALRKVETNSEENFSWEELKKHFIGDEKVTISH